MRLHSWAFVPGVLLFDYFLLLGNVQQLDQRIRMASPHSHWRTRFHFRRGIDKAETKANLSHRAFRDLRWNCLYHCRCSANSLRLVDVGFLAGVNHRWGHYLRRLQFTF